MSAKLRALVMEASLILISLIRELTVFSDVTSFTTRQVLRMSPSFTRKAKSKSLFKEKVHTIMLKIFEVQNRYADLNTIISDFKKY